MTESTNSGSGRRWIVVAVVIALLLMLLVTCRSRNGTALKEAPKVADEHPAPALPSLREGLEWVSRDAAADLLTIRDRATGDTISLGLANATPGKIEAAFALKAKERAATPPSKSAAAPPATALVGASLVPPPPPPSSATAGSKLSAVVAPPAQALKSPESTGLPAFVPEYPGATTLTLSALSERGSTHGAYVFTTGDLPDAVGKFYAEKVTAQGLTVIVNVASTNKDGATFTLIAEDTATSRSLSLTAAIEAGKTRGSIEFSGK